MVMAGGNVSASRIRGCTVAGVRAVATVISAPRADSALTMRHDTSLTFESAPSSVPSISLTYSVFCIT